MDLPICSSERAECAMRDMENTLGMDWDDVEREDVIRIVLAALEEEARIALREAACAVPHGGWDHVDVERWLRERAQAQEKQP